MITIIVYSNCCLINNSNTYSMYCMYLNVQYAVNAQIYAQYRMIPRKDGKNEPIHKLTSQIKKKSIGYLTNKYCM